MLDCKFLFILSKYNQSLGITEYNSIFKLPDIPCFVNFMSPVSIEQNRNSLINICQFESAY